MALVLFRVDERLIHGQVVLAWAAQVSPGLYVVADDALAGSEWEQDLYRMSITDGTPAEFLTVEDARSRIEAWKADPRRVVVLTRDVESMLRLAEGGVLAGEHVNVGGIHHAPGRERVAPYVYLDGADRQRLRELGNATAGVSARDLPGSTAVSLETLIAP